MKESGYQSVDHEKIETLRRACYHLCKDVMQPAVIASKANVNLDHLREFIRQDRKKRTRLDLSDFYGKIVEYIVKMDQTILGDSLRSDINNIKKWSLKGDISFDDIFGVNLTDMMPPPEEFFGDFIYYRHTFGRDDIVRSYLKVYKHKKFGIALFANKYVSRNGRATITNGSCAYLNGFLYLSGYVERAIAQKSFVISQSSGGRYRKGLVMTYSPELLPFATTAVLIPVQDHVNIKFEQENYENPIINEEIQLDNTKITIPLGIFTKEVIEEECKQITVGQADAGLSIIKILESRSEAILPLRRE